MADNPRLAAAGREAEEFDASDGMDRRTALKVFGASGIAVGLAPHLLKSSSIHALLAPPSAPVPSLSVTVFRRADLFDLRFDFYNLVLNTSGPPALVRQIAGLSAYVVVGFPMQHIGEEAGPLRSQSTAAALAFASGRRVRGRAVQLAFSVPKTVTSIPFTMDGLLGWAAWSPKLTSATSIASHRQAGPGQFDTFVEAPWRLFLSPDATGQWHHSSEPITHGNWTELWQTRLGKGAVEPPASTPHITAIWTPAWPALGPADPFPMPLENTDRRDIVTLTTGGRNPNGAPFPAIPIPAKLFMLTPLGASMDLDGRWNEPGVSSLIEWRERMTTGRDSYVRIVRAGFVFPFGHKAVWIIISEREFQVDPSGGITAFLVQKQYVQITEPSKTYPGRTPEPYNGRKNPLRTIVVKTTVTPPLDPPVFIPTSESQGAFWPIASGSPVPFSFQGIDAEGRRIDFTTNVIWVDEEAAFDFATSVPNIEAENSAAPTRLGAARDSVVSSWLSRRRLRPSQVPPRTTRTRSSSTGSQSAMRARSNQPGSQSWRTPPCGYPPPSR